MQKIVVKIMKDGSLHVETVGMSGDTCKPYVEKMSVALQAIPINLHGEGISGNQQGTHHDTKTMESINSRSNDAYNDVDDKESSNLNYLFFIR